MRDGLIGMFFFRTCQFDLLCLSCLEICKGWPLHQLPVNYTISDPQVLECHGVLL